MSISEVGHDEVQMENALCIGDQRGQKGAKGGRASPVRRLGLGYEYCTLGCTKTTLQLYRANL